MDGYVLVSVRGEIDAATSSQFRPAPVAAQGPSDIVVDLSDVHGFQRNQRPYEGGMSWTCEPIGSDLEQSA